MHFRRQFREGLVARLKAGVLSVSGRVFASRPFGPAPTEAPCIILFTPSDTPALQERGRGRRMRRDVVANLLGCAREGELVRVVMDVWDETALVCAERDASHALRDEAWVEARAFEAENVTLRARQADMEAEIATLRTEVRRLNALEFWDRVMREIAAVLPRDAWGADRDVLRLLPPSLA